MPQDYCVDVVLFGGGAAGLWTLDSLTRRGISAVLLEASALGCGQTVSSQGIIHGGLKYTLQGLLTQSASNIAEMPQLWRDCLEGRREPELTKTRVRSEHCHLWRTDSIASRMGMIGAKFGLRVAPQSVSGSDRPAVLRRCPGDVARLDEQVISPASLLKNLADRNAGRILRVDVEHGLDFSVDPRGNVTMITLHRTEAMEKAPSRAGSPVSLRIRPKHVVFTAGAGNAELRRAVGLSFHAMQRRPLHMAMVRGNLPVLNGHCVDGAKTRVTITSDADAQGRTVWQVGGQIAEDGVGQDSRALAQRTADELRNCIPGIDLTGAEFATYRVDRAEAATPGGQRPETFQVLHEANVVTAWPTKLVLAPVLAEDIMRRVAVPREEAQPQPEWPADWPRPAVASPPWETARDWMSPSQAVRRAA